MEPFEPIARAAASVLLVVLLTRLNGLRSFSKMSGFDFVTTVATGSVIATAITSGGDGFWVAMLGLVGLYLVQAVLAQARKSSGGVKDAMDNRPLLLMEDGQFLEHNMRRAGIAHSDVWAKLRAANAIRPQDVRAVVLETTGDVSVLHGDVPVPPDLLDGVVR